MHTPTGYYAAHNSLDNPAESPAGMTSKRLHRFKFDRNRKANPHMMQSADYHIYNMVAHQDPFSVPGGPDSQALIIEEACGLLRRVRCPEIQLACLAPYSPELQDDNRSYHSGSAHPVSDAGSKRSGRSGGGYNPSGRQANGGMTPYSQSDGGSQGYPRKGDSDAGSYAGPRSARESMRGSQGARSARSYDAGSRRSGGYSQYSGSAYSGAGSPTSPQRPGDRPRSSDGGRGYRRSSQAGSEMRSEYSRRSARSVDSRSRMSGDSRSYYSETSSRMDRRR